MLKWGTLGSNDKSTKVLREQMGTKPAKVGRLGPRCAKVRRGPHPAPTGASAKRSSIHAASKFAKVGAAGGPKLLTLHSQTPPEATFQIGARAQDSTLCVALIERDR